MVDRVKGKEGPRMPSSSPGWADFTIMMECMPEKGHCHSVYFVLPIIKYSYDKGKSYTQYEKALPSINHSIFSGD
jgi:hypothetical protein